MKKIIIYTQAYNAESSLKRAINSILSQTYGDFIYYVMDNGSNDNTWDLIQSSIHNDKRIIPLQNISNNQWPEGSNWLDFLWNHNEDDYFCILDADDEYHYYFLEKMITFINKYQLDIAVCGNDFISSTDNTLIGRRIISQNMIIEGKGFSEEYPVYHQFMRTLWGKMFSVGAMRQILESKEYLRFGNPTYGRDTLITQEAFRRAKRVGILSESLHKYYLSKSSDSHQFNNTRIISDRILFDSAKEYLNSKCGGIIPVNYQFILEVYSIAIFDTMSVIIKSDMILKNKLEGIVDILKSTQTRELIERVNGKEELQQRLRKVTTWIEYQKEAVHINNRNLIADVFAILEKVPVKEFSWETSDYLLLLIDIRSKGFKSELLDHIIDKVSNEFLLLMGLKVPFLLHFQELTEYIANKELDEALNFIWNMIEREEDIPDVYVEQFLDLGINISAKLEKNKDFIYLKKLKIQYLINASKPELALEELSDWDKVLPDDVDFALFRSLLNK